MTEKISKLHSKLVSNHQQLTSMRSLLSKRSDKYSELKIEIMMDILADTITDLSAYIIISNLKDDSSDKTD